jgi:hypothetical protein
MQRKVGDPGSAHLEIVPRAGSRRRKRCRTKFVPRNDVELDRGVWRPLKCLPYLTYGGRPLFMSSRVRVQRRSSGRHRALNPLEQCPAQRTPQTQTGWVRLLKPMIRPGPIPSFEDSATWSNERNRCGSRRNRNLLMGSAAPRGWSLDLMSCPTGNAPAA